MKKPPFSCDEILERMTPLLERVFAAYGVSEREAEEITAAAFAGLISKKTGWRNPEGWLLRAVDDRCRALKEGGNR